MKVCFVSFEYPPNIYGGAGIYAETIIRGLKSRGLEVFVISRGNQWNYNDKTFRIPMKEILYWGRLFFSRPAVGLLHKLNKILKFDLVHMNEPHFPLLWRPDLPTVCTLHSCQANEFVMRLRNINKMKTVREIKDLVLKSPLGSILDLCITHDADRIICPSYQLAQMIESYYLVNREKVFVIPNGVDLKMFDRVDNRDINHLSRYGLNKDNYILYIGRLTLFKGVQYLIGAFGRIKKEHPNLKLAIVGTGDFGMYLRNIAHGIKDVVFVGQVSSLRVKKALYENSIAVVVPSFFDTLPTVVLEAMACRKPVIASDTGGIPSLVKHGKNGFLVKPRDSESLARFIKILVEDPNLRKRMGSFGRRLAENEFSIDQMINKTIKVYDSLVQA